VSDPARSRVFLFLQGPNCGFFAGLARRLRLRGYTCLRINLCFADWFFWAGPGAHNFRGSLQKWPEFLAAFYEKHGVTDLLLLGEQRDYHKVAVKLARERGIQVTVTEWGYLRPDWITLEKEGMSGESLFPRDPEQIRALAAEVGEPDFRKLYPDAFWRVALHGVFADTYTWMLHFLYPGYRSHLLANPIWLYICAGWRIWRAKRNSRQTRKSITRLRTQSKTAHPYFVFPMQIEMDFQIRAYSPFSGMEEVLRLVIGSFARHAPRGTRLLIKLHPLDPGLKNWQKIVDSLAEEAGVGRRVFFFDGGSFDVMVKSCVGVVAVNSTASLSALQNGKPVKVLGSAIYDITGLVDPQPLDGFWQNPQPPDMELVHNFIRAIAGCIQIKGGFFSKAGLAAAIEGAEHRILGDRVNTPVPFPPMENFTQPPVLTKKRKRPFWKKSQRSAKSAKVSR
jgi:capsular polysaccharide export protein